MEKKRRVVYKCSECGKYIDWMQAALTAGYLLCEQCFGRSIRARSHIAYKALSTKKGG